MEEDQSNFNIWSQRDLGVDLSAEQILGSVSSDDVEYVCDNNYPFIQLISTDAVFVEDIPLKFTTASTGWVIHDYGQAISVSALSGNSGGIVNQAITAEQIAKIIAEKKWGSVEVIAGTQMMKRFIWVESKRAKFDLTGYTPNTNDEKCYARLAKHAKDVGITWERPPIKVQQKGASTAK